MGHSLYFYDMLVEVTYEILFNLQKIPWACQNRRLQVMKGGVSCSWLFGGNFQKQCDVRRQGLVCALILRMRITRRKGMLTTDMQSVANIADMSLYYCGGYRKPIWSRKGLSINFDEWTRKNGHNLHAFLGQYFRGQIYLDKSLYILRVKMYDAAAVLMMVVILT